MRDPTYSGGDSRPWRVMTWIVLMVPGLLLAVWFWIRFCWFPLGPWNDLRLAPTIAFARGIPVYSTAGENPITTWMYGPLPILFNLPATLAHDAIGALLIAGGMNLLLTVVPVTLVCYRWPVAREDGNVSAWRERSVALVLALALWPEQYYSTLFSDNLAVALGLCGNLLLVRPPRHGGLWLAACAATATLACKQIAVGIPLAQIAWLGLTAGRHEAMRHAWRCAVVGAAFALGAVGIFGWEPLRFMLLEIPGDLPWAVDFLFRLQTTAPTLIIQIGAPLGLWLFLRRRGQPPARELLLPFLAWACTLPVGLAGCFRSGGWTNSIHSFVLWLPPVLVTLLTIKTSEKFRRSREVVAVLAALALVSGRLLQEPAIVLRPQVEAYHEAAQLAAAHPRAIWFPVNPLVTLYSEGRYYHDEDGLYVRVISGHMPGVQHVVAGLPPNLHFIAYQCGVGSWGIARGMMTTNSREQAVGSWNVIGGIAYPPP